MSGVAVDLVFIGGVWRGTGGWVCLLFVAFVGWRGVREFRWVW